MKIRTDFVTNSSSSSFTVSLDMLVEKNKHILLSESETFGDADWYSCSLQVTNAKGTVLKNERYDPFLMYMSSADEFVDTMPAELEENFVVSASPVDLRKIVTAKSGRDIVDEVRESFGIGECSNRGAINEDGEPLEFEDETLCDIQDELQSQFKEIVDAGESVLSSSITKPESVKKVVQTTEFSGYGEFLSDKEYILKKIFPLQEAVEIQRLLEKNDTDGIREIEYLQCYTAESIDQLMRFWSECSCQPANCKVTQTLEDGKIDMQIAFEEDG